MNILLSLGFTASRIDSMAAIAAANETVSNALSNAAGADSSG